MHKKHFILGNEIAEVRKFTPRSKLIKKEMPQRNRGEHAELLKEQYHRIVSQAIALQDELAASHQPVANGVYMDLEMNKKFISGGLDTKTGAQVLKVSEEQENGDIDVTVFIKRKNKDWLTKKADEYANIDGEKNPKNEKLIAPINEITPADIHSLYESPTAFDDLAEETVFQFELWISKREDYSVDTVSQALAILCIECNIEHRLQFVDVDVFLIKATKEILKLLPNHLGYIEGVRRYRQPSILTETHETNREWNKLLRNEINFAFTDDSVRVGILDTGVNNAHDLLKHALPDDRMSTAINTLDSIDHSFHGTDMAGLALLGDLTELAYRRDGNMSVEHSLASVKIFENEIVPFIQGDYSVNYNEMHYYDLPWPVELLEVMHDETVTMRVTLSYYVKPAPGTGGKNNKYRYPSATLHFDVKSASETEKEFLRRRNKNEGEPSATNDSNRWKIGQQRRENGTVQSDWFTCTAQQLAECGKIVVFPGSGWWKERKLENIDNVIKYSLVVSIRSERTEVYQAVETAISNRIGIQIA